MRDETIKALKVLRKSKALGLDRDGFERLVGDLCGSPLEDLWQATEKPAKSPKKPTDPLLLSVRQALSKYKASAPAKAKSLVDFLLPDRQGPMPKGMAAALKLLRTYFSDEEVLAGAQALMVSLRTEVGTDVPL